MDLNLPSLPRQLIELRLAHVDQDGLIDRYADIAPADGLSLHRLKKRRLGPSDQMARLAAEIDPPEPA